MTQYGNRLLVVEEALTAEKVHPAKCKTLTQAAVSVLAAIHNIKENVR